MNRESYSEINDQNTNQCANLALWAEGGWFPSIWLTDPRVCWWKVDENTALLHVPLRKHQKHLLLDSILRVGR